VFATDAVDSNQIGAYAIDGSGLSAGNYLFVQDAANAAALLITPPSEPSGPGGTPSVFYGAIASASQAESACAQLRDAAGDEALCAVQMNFRQTQQVNLVPGWRRVIDADGTTFTRNGAGIRLPEGTQVQ
jgi:hypothetical protein